MNHAALNRLLTRYAHLPPEYQGGLSSHLPMALHALAALGADERRLQDFAQTYAGRFQPAPARAALQLTPPADWRRLRGAGDQPEAYAALQATFAAMLEVQGADTTLRQVLPELWSGLAGAAFHGLIRTAHAVQAGHRDELAQALAYWAWRWQAMQAAVAPREPLAPQDWVDALRKQACGWQSPQRLISRRMRDVQATPAYADLAERLQPAPGGLEHTLQLLAAFAAGRYAASRNFTVLHMVTACRAALVLVPWLEPGAEQIGQLSRAYAAAYLSCGDDVDLDVLPSIDMTWSAVVEAALQSDDDHAVKLVHACREFHALGWPGPWLAAAARVVQRP